MPEEEWGPKASNVRMLLVASSPIQHSLVARWQLQHQVPQHTTTSQIERLREVAMILSWGWLYLFIREEIFLVRLQQDPHTSHWLLMIKGNSGFCDWLRAMIIYP